LKINNIEIDGVIFDFDGTLYDKKNQVLYFIMYNLSNIKTIKEMNSVKKKLSGIDFGNAETFYKEMFTELGKRTKKTPKQVKDWYFNKLFPNVFRMMKKKYKPRPLLSEVLYKLKSNNVKIALLSDYPYVKERLEVLNIDVNYFTHIASSEEYGMLKPSKRVLTEIAKILCSSEDRTLVVGDKDEADGESARMSGMPFIQITDKKAKPSKNVMYWEDFSKMILS